MKRLWIELPGEVQYLVARHGVWPEYKFVPHTHVADAESGHRLCVEPEVHHVAIIDNIFLAFEAELACGLAT